MSPDVITFTSQMLFADATLEVGATVTLNELGRQRTCKVLAFDGETLTLECPTDLELLMAEIDRPHEFRFPPDQTSH